MSDRELQLDEFDFIRKDRTRHGGGVIIYVKKQIGFQRLIDIECDLEALWIKVRLRNTKPLLICVLYRPPNSSTEFFDKLTSMLNKALDLEGEVLVMGDLNCDLLSDKLDSNSQTLLSVMHGSLLTQLITSPTRVSMNSKTLIDHIHHVRR